MAAADAAIYVVVMPVAEMDYVPLHPRREEDYAGFRAALSDLAAQTVARVIDPAQPDWSIAEFADPLHLNGAGADRPTDWLAGSVDNP